MTFSSLRIWRQAGVFLFRDAKLLVATPLFFVPVLTDVLHSVLIDEERKGQRCSVVVALRRALPLLPMLIKLKLYYVARALLWAFVPIYGLIRGVDERLAWGMASNVLVFDGYGEMQSLRARCEELAQRYRGEGIRALVTMPTLLFVGAICLFALGSHSSIFWAAVFACLWIAIPGAAAANTYLYVWTREHDEGLLSASHVEPTPSGRRTRKWAIAIGIPLGAIVLLIFAFGALVQLGVIPPSAVIDGKHLSRRNRAFLEKEGIIEPDEAVQMFYSTGLISIADDGNLLTDKRVISYGRTEGKLFVDWAPFDQVTEVRITRTGDLVNDTIIEVQADDSHEFVLFLSAEDGGDRRFIAELKRRARTGTNGAEAPSLR